MQLVEVVLRNRKDAQVVVLGGKLEVVESGEDVVQKKCGPCQNCLEGVCQHKRNCLMKSQLA